MHFRFVDCQTLFLACLILGLLPVAEAQSQPIIFSSPDGQVTTNAPIPMVQAPEGRETPNLPSGEVAVHEFSDPLEAPMVPQLPPPMPQQPDAQNPDDFRNPMDVRKQMGAATPGQIMNVPTEEQIFGLPEKTTMNGQKEPWQLDNENSENGATNETMFATNSFFAEPSWARLWAENTGKSPQSSNTTEKTSGFFSKFFDSGQSDDAFGNHDANGDGAFLGSSQPAVQQSSWDSGLAAGGLTPASAGASPNNFAGPAGSSSGLASQSPFTPPQVSTLDTMPKLPALPSLPGQNGQLPQPASTPSWGPKPPPWTQSQTPFGTPVPQNPALKR